MKSNLATPLSSRRRAAYHPHTLIQGCKAVVVAMSDDNQPSTIIIQQAFDLPVLGIDVHTGEIVQRSTIHVTTGQALHFSRAVIAARGSYFYITGSPELTGGKPCTCVAGLSGEVCEHQPQPISA